jgi:hypothetical protein
MTHSEPPIRPNLSAALVACTREIELALALALNSAGLADPEAARTLIESLQSARARLVAATRPAAPPARLASREAVAKATGHGDGGRYEELPGRLAAIAAEDSGGDDGPPTVRRPGGG